MSTLKVGTIQSTTANTAITIDNAGTVNLPVNNNITQFSKNGDQDTSSASAVIMTNWLHMNSQANFGFQQVGTAWTESGGEFSTTRLGVYRVYLECHIRTLTSTGPRYIQLDIALSPNSGGTIGGDIYSNTPYTGDTTYDLHTRCKYYNIIHANDRIHTRIGSVQNVRVRGGGTDFDTTLMFEWLAPPV